MLTSDEKARLNEAVRQYHLAELLCRKELESRDVTEANSALDELLRLINDDLAETTP